MALAAAEAADVAPDRLIEAIIEDERKRELLARAVEEGARSINDQNIRAIAHAFAIGALASDSAVVDDAMIAIDIIGQLGATHWRLISILVRKSQMTGLDPTREETVKRYQFAWTREEIYNLDPGIKQAFDPVIGRLTGLGIALDLAIGTWDYQPRWALTDFGKTCAEYMRVIGTALPPE